MEIQSILPAFYFVFLNSGHRTTSHIFLTQVVSATDIETQENWQKVNPRNIALVYDPVHDEVKAFRIKREEDTFKEVDIPVKIQN